MTDLHSLAPALGYAASGLARYLPEPSSAAGLAFRTVARGVGAAISGAGGAAAGLDPQYAELINKQIEMQEQLQLISLHSNIERSRHETQMAAIRNIRAG